VLESFETGLDSNIRSSPGPVSCAILLGLRFVCLKLSLLPPSIFATVLCWSTSRTRRTPGASVATARRPHILLGPEGSETAINSKQGRI